MRKLIGISAFLLLNFFISDSVFASANFTTDYNVTYIVKDDASTHVNFDITLTNKTSNYYASSFNIQLGFKNIESLTAYDSQGTITPTITKEKNVENITLEFNKKVVGENKKLNFRISFDTAEVVEKNGQIWQIDIPGLSDQNDFNSFSVTVKTPSFLKNPIFIKPNVIALDANNLTFSKEQLGRSGISIAFGHAQIYGFNLLYHLANKNLFPIKTEIAIPPTTNYQEVEIDDISPRPTDVLIDNDGNWLAQYVLSPSQKINVTVNGKVKIALLPKEELVPSEKLRDYLKEQPFWQTSNESIKNLGTSLKTAKAIYDYVVKNLKYDYGRVDLNKKRLGAVDVLKNKDSAVCLEFTDLFIALSRSAGIPAREINGFAYTQNSKERPLSLVKDILHAWPEYYDKDLKTWIMVDPTWGNTTSGVDYFNTLDFDHFAFVVKGMDSKYPVSGGGYKLPEDAITQDVNVSFTNNFESVNPKITISDSFSKTYFSNLKVLGSVVIKNVGKQLADPKTLIITTKFLSPNFQKIILDKIPPYGSKTIPIAFAKTPILTNKTDEVTITIANSTISKNIRIYPLFLDLRFIVGGILIVSTSIIVSFVAFKSGRLPVSQPKQ